MPDRLMLLWMAAGAVATAAILAMLLVAGRMELPHPIPATPRFGCICPDSIAPSGPRSLTFERH